MKKQLHTIIFLTAALFHFPAFAQTGDFEKMLFDFTEEDDRIELTADAELYNPPEKDGDASVKAWGNGQAFQYPWSIPGISVTPGMRLQLSFSFATAGNFKNNQFIFIIFFTDDGGKATGQERTPGQSARGEWQHVDHLFTVPAGSTKMKVSLRFINVAKDGFLFCDDVYIGPPEKIRKKERKPMTVKTKDTTESSKPKAVSDFQFEKVHLTFEEDNTYLVLSSCAKVTDEEKKAGDFSVRCWGNGIVSQYPWSYGPVDVAAGIPLQVSITYKTAGAIKNGQTLIIIFFTDDSGAATGQERSAMFPASTTGWHTIHHVFTVPDSSTKMKVTLRFCSIPEKGVMWCDDVYIGSPRPEDAGKSTAVPRSAAGSQDRTAGQVQPARSNKPLLTYRRPEGLPEYRALPKLLQGTAAKEPWLGSQRDTIISNAEYWLTIPDDFLWKSIPDQTVPRTLWVNREKGCPVCGPSIHQGYGYYPWITDPGNKPWKVKCPKCNTWFPGNDFHSYYISGLNEKGFFDSNRADKKLLFNTEYPDPKHKNHSLYVDSGSGWIDGENNRWMFAGTYNLQSYWGRRPYPEGRYTLSSGALDLAYAWLFTGDIRYARKAGIIISRVAGLFPAMDYLYWTGFSKDYSAQHRVPGKMLDFIWENFLISKFLKTYGIIADAVKDDSVLTAFLSTRKAHLQLPSGSDQGNLFIENIEYNYLKEIYGNVRIGNIRGNLGMCEESLTLAALVTWDTNFRAELTRWLFAPASTVSFNTPEHLTTGGGLGEIVFKLTRDGFSWESGGYGEMLPRSLTEINKMISQFTWVEKTGSVGTVISLYGDRLAAYYNNKFKLSILDRHQPAWGDNGTFCRAYNIAGVNPSVFLDGYLMTGDPGIGSACRSILNSPEIMGETSLIWNNLFYFSPEAIHNLTKMNSLPLLESDQSLNGTGRGIVLLKSGTGKYRRALFMHYGNNHDCHNHRDTLGLQLYAYGRTILPSHGYPDLALTKMNHNWHHSAIANNLVVVNRQSLLRRMQIADQKLLAETALASVCDIDAGRAYPDLERYRRLCAMINISGDDFYVIDFFEVKGGHEHVYSFHSGDGTLSWNPDIRFTAQKQGTYAGPDISYGSDFRYEGVQDAMHRYGNGYAWLYDVARSGPQEGFETTWDLVNTHDTSPFGNSVRTTLTMLTPVQEIATAYGKPTQNFKGNPEGIPYILAKNTDAGGKLVSDYIGVIETYLENKRSITGIKLLAKRSGDNFASAVKLTFKSGKSDIIIRQGSVTTKGKYAENLSMTGRFAIIRFDEKSAVREIMAAGVSEITYGQFSKKYTPLITGKVIDFTKGVSSERTIVIDAKIPLNGLTDKDGNVSGAQLWADVSPSSQTKDERLGVPSTVDPNYPVTALKAHPRGLQIFVGPGSFIHNSKGGDLFSVKKAEDSFNYEIETGGVCEIQLVFYEKF